MRRDDVLVQDLSIVWAAARRTIPELLERLKSLSPSV